MPFPLIPVLAGLAVAGGAGTLIWYYSQSKEKRAEADQLAIDHFGKTIEHLSKAEAAYIREQLNE